MQKLQPLFFIACIVLYGCNTINPTIAPFSRFPPHTEYIRSLEKADLDKTLMAKAWIRAGENALHDSIGVNLPFSESGYFKASEPAARSYRFGVREGQVLTIKGAVTSKAAARFFLDLLVWEDEKWKPVEHGDSTFNLIYEFNRDYENCVVRIQPELLVTAYYTISLSLTPVLINPVGGATNKSIGSFYGDPRDGGQRKHEGVDIFAKKGTPVVAPADGYISRVGTGNLGGKVVWMQDIRRGHSYYFAHLDSQAVRPGTKVKQGHLLGTVGNTGNARYTPPHLHFGIYQSKSKDPIHYIRTMEVVAKALPWDTTLTQPDFKVSAKNTVLRNSPDEKRPGRVLLKKNTYLRVIAHSSQWYRIVLPDETQGFVLKSSVTPIVKGKREKIKEPRILLSDTHTDAVPIAHLAPSSTVEVLATFEQYKFVRTKGGLIGWLSI